MIPTSQVRLVTPDDSGDKMACAVEGMIEMRTRGTIWGGGGRCWVGGADGDLNYPHEPWKLIDVVSEVRVEGSAFDGQSPDADVTVELVRGAVKPMEKVWLEKRRYEGVGRMDPVPLGGTYSALERQNQLDLPPPADDDEFDDNDNPLNALCGISTISRLAFTPPPARGPAGCLSFPHFVHPFYTSSVTFQPPPPPSNPRSAKEIASAFCTTAAAASLRSSSALFSLTLTSCYRTPNSIKYKTLSGFPVPPDIYALRYANFVRLDRLIVGGISNDLNRRGLFGLGLGKASACLAFQGKGGRRRMRSDGGVGVEEVMRRGGWDWGFGEGKKEAAEVIRRLVREGMREGRVRAERIGREEKERIAKERKKKKKSKRLLKKAKRARAKLIESSAIQESDSEGDVDDVAQAGPPKKRSREHSPQPPQRRSQPSPSTVVTLESPDPSAWTGLLPLGFAVVPASHPFHPSISLSFSTRLAVAIVSTPSSIPSLIDLRLSRTHKSILAICNYTHPIPCALNNSVGSSTSVPPLHIIHVPKELVCEAIAKAAKAILAADD